MADSGERPDWIEELEQGWRREYPGLDLSALPPVVRLARLGVLIQGLHEEALAPFGLTPADFSVLAALRRVGPPYQASPSGLYSVLQRSSGGMTKMLKRLESLSLVRRTPDPSDGRGSLVSLTDAGRRVQDEAFRTILAETQALFGSFAKGRIKEIDGVLAALLTAFESEPPRARR